MTEAIGVGLLVVAFAMLWIARPRNGEMAPFLRARYVEMTYSVTVTMLIGLGAASVFGGLATIAGG